MESGRFIDMGAADNMLLHWKNPDAETVDLDGKTVTPGLIDSHLHLSAIAHNFLNLDLTGLTSKREILEKIRNHARTLQKGEWLVGEGWDENLFTDSGIPDISELDHVCPHNPLFMPRICHHAFLVNSKALELAGYHPEMSTPEGGRIELDDATGKPTGLLLESASELITRHIPERTYDELKDALGQAISYAMARGLTSVHSNDPRF